MVCILKISECSWRRRHRSSRLHAGKTSATRRKVKVELTALVPYRRLKVYQSGCFFMVESVRPPQPELCIRVGAGPCVNMCIPVSVCVSLCACTLCVSVYVRARCVYECVWLCQAIWSAVSGAHYPLSSAVGSGAFSICPSSLPSSIHPSIPPSYRYPFVSLSFVLSFYLSFIHMSAWPVLYFHFGFLFPTL